METKVNLSTSNEYNIKAALLKSYPETTDKKLRELTSIYMELHKKTGISADTFVYNLSPIVQTITIEFKRCDGHADALYQALLEM